MKVYKRKDTDVDIVIGYVPPGTALSPQYRKQPHELFNESIFAPELRVAALTNLDALSPICSATTRNPYKNMFGLMEVAGVSVVKIASLKRVRKWDYRLLFVRSQRRGYNYNKQRVFQHFFIHQNTFTITSKQ